MSKQDSKVLIQMPVTIMARLHLLGMALEDVVKLTPA